MKEGIWVNYGDGNLGRGKIGVIMTGKMRKQNILYIATENSEYRQVTGQTTNIILYHLNKSTLFLFLTYSTPNLPWNSRTSLQSSPQSCISTPSPTISYPLHLLSSTHQASTDLVLPENSELAPAYKIVKTDLLCVRDDRIFFAEKDWKSAARGHVCWMSGLVSLGSED